VIAAPAISAAAISRARDGDAANAILTAVDYNFGLVRARLREFLCLLLITLRSLSNQYSDRLVNGRLCLVLPE
jgi:hypothetical protein